MHKAHKTYLQIFSWSLLIFAVFAINSTSLADTIILKDGRKIRCDAAREEEKLVRYWIGDSVLSVARDKVDRIERDSNGGERLSSDISSSTPADRKLSEIPKLLPDAPSAGAPLTAEYLAKLEANVKAAPSNAKFRAELAAALNTVAYAELKAGSHSRAKEFLERALALDDRNSTALTLSASAAIRESRYTNALAYANRAVEVDSKDYIAYYLAGVSYYALEKLPEAVKALQTALHINGNMAEAKRLLEKAERDAAVARDFTSSRSRFFNISMEGGTVSPALESSILGYLEESYALLKRQFGYEPSDKISVIFYTGQTFSNVTNAPSWVGALNDGKLRIPVGGLSSADDILSKFIVHELTHSFVHFKGQGRCPTWLNEGLAQIMEGKSSSNKFNRLSELHSSGILPPLQSLSGSFMGFNPESADVAYAFSLFAAENLSERGLRSAIDILGDLGQNQNINEALSRHTRYKNLNDFEQELKRRLTRQ